jgi:hypothetical protein
MITPFISTRFWSAFVLCITLAFATPLLAHAASNDIQGYIVTISLFIKYILLPFLFGVAFLFFTFNIVRYFILGSASDEGRSKAKRSALYGIAAFVFLFTLWGLVTVLVQGIGIEGKNGNESLCPDYLKNSFGSSVCDNIDSKTGTASSFPSATFTDGGSVSGATGGTRRLTGGGTGSGNSGNSGSGNSGGRTNPNFSGLAELIFGTGKDSTSFTTYPGTPRALYQVPTITSNASCIDGIKTLILANRVETTQAAYALYKDTSGATHWKNITDLSAKNNISYDKDTLDDLLQTNITNLHIIHTHPRIRAKDFSLTMEGHGPSAADMRSMCINNDTSITYAIADWSGVWTLTQQSDTCPYSPSARNILPLMETYATLASLEASTREDELTKYMEVSITPSQYKTHFAARDISSFSSLTPEEMLALSDDYQVQASTTVEYSKSAEIFCAGF